MSKSSTEQVRAHFIQGIGRISHFWGFPKAMGAAYAAIYLSPDPISMDELVNVVGVTKGALSIHMRTLERLGVVHRDGRAGDRKDYFTADSDFWGVVRRILREREKKEFDRALRSVEECLRLLDAVPKGTENAALVAFYRDRLTTIMRFFASLDRIVATVLAMETFRRSAFDKFFGRATPKKRGD